MRNRFTVVDRRRLVCAGLAAIGVAAIVWARSGQITRARLRRIAQQCTHRARYASGKLAGLRYRLQGRHPDESAPDLVLADRIRSEIGPLVSQLDLPHPHVMVIDHVAMLHGDVATDRDAALIAQAVLDVRGVQGVRSFLHIGLLDGDTRPSDGREHPPPSTALSLLLNAARGAGAERAPLHAVRIVLGSFFDRVPDGERAHVYAHLPDDVKRIAAPPHISGAELARIRATSELYTGVEAVDSSVDTARARAVVVAVLGCLADLVPEERADIHAVLPATLRALWADATAVGAAG